MLIAGFPAGPLGANCYVVAAGPGTPCVVVDPGQDATTGLARVVADNALTPVAVLLTHGHIDHMASASAVCTTYGATAYIHPADRHLLSDPLAGLDPQLARMLAGADQKFTEPDRVEEFADGQELEVAGLRFTVVHAPGHTAGSVLLSTPYDGPEDVPAVLFSGDVLFAGSIGRTDLPGGDHPAMLHTLATRVLPLRDELAVLPGHGGRTTIGREKATNPYLQDLETSQP